MFDAPGVVLKGLSEAFAGPGVVLVEAPSEALEGPGVVLAVLAVLVVLVEAPSEALEGPGVLLEGTPEKLDIE